MKEHPIIFNTDMVKAILEGRKTQTRRVIKLKGYHRNVWDSCVPHNGETAALLGEPYLKVPYDAITDNAGTRITCPYGQVGDRLWVRETCYKDTVGDWRYKADEVLLPMTANYTKREVIPSIFMPRWASRITLEITEVRVEQLMKIDIRDIHPEGIRLPEDKVGYWGKLYVDAFHNLWDSLNAKHGYGWDTNPWVWVIEFKRLEI